MAESGVVATGEQAASAAAWFPASAAAVGTVVQPHLSIVVYGRSGVGKSFLGRQLMLDPDYGPGEVLFVMAEDNTSLYGEGARVARIARIGEANAVIDSLVVAHREGRRLPKVVFFDSISGIMDYEREALRKNPPISDRTGRPDMFAAFGELGYGMMTVLTRLRDEIPVDAIITVTTHEADPNLPPELAVDGKLVPKNITRLSNVALYMKAQLVEYDPKTTQAQPASHRTVVVNESGAAEGKLVNRYFFTQDAGEVMAKGHFALLYRERAILPDVLRKIHSGRQAGSQG